MQSKRQRYLKNREMLDGILDSKLFDDVTEFMDDHKYPDRLSTSEGRTINPRAFLDE